MPGFDGTGPQGRGPMTGRGLGPCGSGRAFRRGFGRGFGRGFRRGVGRGFGRGFRRAYLYDYDYTPATPVTPALTDDQEIQLLEGDIRYLEEERKLLNQDLEAIRKRLNDLREKK